jgi:hypothetical protein
VSFMNICSDSGDISSFLDALIEKGLSQTQTLESQPIDPAKKSGDVLLIITPLHDGKSQLSEMIRNDRFMKREIRNLIGVPRTLFQNLRRYPGSLIHQKSVANSLSCLFHPISTVPIMIGDIQTYDDKVTIMLIQVRHPYFKTIPQNIISQLLYHLTEKGVQNFTELNRVTDDITTTSSIPIILGKDRVVEIEWRYDDNDDILYPLKVNLPGHNMTVDSFLIEGGEARVYNATLDDLPAVMRIPAGDWPDQPELQKYLPGRYARFYIEGIIIPKRLRC